MTAYLPTFHPTIWRPWSLVLSLACFLLPCALVRGQAVPANPLRQIAYTLTPLRDENGLRFAIELRFPGHEAGRTELLLPSRTGGQAQLYEAIQKLEILPAAVKVEDTSEPWVKVLTHEPGQAIRVRYELVQDRTDALQALRGAGFRPVLQPTYFHWLGTAWVRPGLEETEPLAFTMEWKNLPAEWVLSNTFGTQQRTQRFTTTLRSLASSVFVGGDFRLRAVPVQNHTVQMALRGAWQFSDEELATLVGRVFTLMRGFWNDYEYPNYLITLLPLLAPANGAANSGTGLDNSFAMFATSNSTLHNLQYLLAHELFHNWNPRRLGRIPNPPESLYWFSEGVTDYYAYRLLWRGGLMTLEEYLAKYNEALRGYYTSPVRHAPNERLAREFFSDSEIARLAYWRGRLLAGNWDALIRAASAGRQSLDDVLRELVGSRQELNAETISAVVSRYAKVEVLPQLQRINDGSELVEPRATLFGTCAERVAVDVGEYELGFDLDALQTKMEIQRVVPGSAAHRAGLRDGQRVTFRPAFQFGDASQEIELTVKDSGKEKTIRFTPSRGDKVRVPQFKLTASRHSQKINCERAF